MTQSNALTFAAVLRSRGRNNSLHDINRAAASVEALDLAIDVLAPLEPGDSRAVSDTFVALAAVACGDTSDRVMKVIREARDRVNSCPCGQGEEPCPRADGKPACSDEPSPSDRIENARQAASETHDSWKHRCYAIMSALGLDYGDPDFMMPDEQKKLTVAEAKLALVEAKLADAEKRIAALRTAVRSEGFA